MVKFTQKLDRNNRIYIVKPLRESGLTNTVEILPNSQAAVIYKAGTPTRDLVASLETIMVDLRYHLKREQEAEQEQ
ncbi:MAG: hypothetical protein NWE77_06480 [Candidatus Bathyarchaeota archaeon]|jgi:hypothetical protein|nr:hypothetical protein [Candidatus Bathyarchaeota archaeon]